MILNVCAFQNGRRMWSVWSGWRSVWPEGDVRNECRVASESGPLADSGPGYPVSEQQLQEHP